MLLGLRVAGFEGGKGQVRVGFEPADVAEGLRPVSDELQEEQNKHEAVRTVWQAYDVRSPHCGQEAGAWCLKPGQPHFARSKQARKLTEQQEPRF
ncbi:hypothetical protein ACIQWR_38815 [Streptomyces sp. NPDC098789]|uniref:hypothetical protein n=1 Tax=Streptomyces sp. NPDC098789 TaxID=3366098 RepID=UPI0037F6D9B7